MAKWIKRTLANYGIILVLVVGSSLLVHYAGLLVAFLILAAIMVFVSLTEFFWFRIFAKAHPYDGQYGGDLMAFMRDRGFTVKYLSVTQSKISNASAIGILGGKAVNFTSNLIEKHPLDEIEAVLAHEIGHHKNHDIYIFTAIGAIILFVASVLDVSLSSWLGGGLSSLAIISVIVATAAFIFLVAPISRWREGLADEYALRVIPDPKALARFFERMLAFMKENGETTPENPSALRRLVEFHPWVYKRIKRASSAKE